MRGFLLASATCAAISHAAPQSANARTWDAVAEFSSATATGPVWSYNYSLDGVTTGLTPLPNYGFFDNNPRIKWSGDGKLFAIKVWRDAELNANAQNAYLTLGANRTDFAWTYPNSGGIPAHTLLLEPPAQGTVALTFTSPARLTATVNYDVTHQSCAGGHGITYTVQQIRPAPYRPFTATIDSGSLLSHSCSNLDSTGNKSAPVALEKGDQINFIIQPNSTTDLPGVDGTLLTASIVTQ